MRRCLTLLILFALTLTALSWTYSLAAEATPTLARLRAHIHQKKVTNYNVLTEGESATVQSDASSSSSTGGESTAAISSTSENTSSSASTSSGGAPSSSGADSSGSSSGSNTANGSSSGGVGSSSGMGGSSSSTSSGSSTNDQSTAPTASSSGTDGPSSSAGATGASSSGVDSSSSTPSGVDSSSSTITSDSSSSGSIDSSSAGDASGSSSDSSASGGVDSSSGSNVSSGDGSSGSYSSSSSTGNSGPDCVIDQGVQLPDPKEVTFRMNRDLASLEDDFKARLRGDILTALGPSVCDKQVAISAITAGSIVVKVKFLALNLRTDSPTPQQIATRFLAQVNNPKRDSVLFTLPTASTTIPDSGSNVQPPSDDDDGSGLTAKVGGVRAWVILLILILIVIALALVFVWVRGLCKRKRSIGSRMSSPKKAESIQNELGHLSTPKSGPGRKYMRQI